MNLKTLFILVAAAITFGQYFTSIAMENKKVETPDSSITKDNEQRYYLRINEVRHKMKGSEQKQQLFEPWYGREKDVIEFIEDGWHDIDDSGTGLLRLLDSKNETISLWEPTGWGFMSGRHNDGSQLFLLTLILRIESRLAEFHKNNCSEPYHFSRREFLEIVSAIQKER